jgi:hypothetical protein
MMIEPTRATTDPSQVNLRKAGRSDGDAKTNDAPALPSESFQASSAPTGTAGGDATGTAHATAKVKVYPQDPLVGPPEELELPKEILGTRLASDRMEIYDRAPVAIADADGNYNYEVGTPQFDQVNAYATVAHTLSMYDRYLGTPARWSFRGPLTVIPHKGVGKTAYFSAGDGSINFFQWDSPSLGKRVTTSQAADVIAHEIGHAIWDGLRPRAGYSNEAGAFHEAFGDSSALLHAMQTESNLVKALEQNGGDMRKPSLLSRMAEEFGTAFNKEDNDPNNDDRPYYRTALNEFKYIDPKKLPDDDYPPTVGENVLTREFHSFSRVWSGAMYRMLTSLYEGEKADGKSSLEALKAARDKLGFNWGKALQELPPSGIRYAVVAESMLRTAAREADKSTFDRLASVLVDRDILTRQKVDELRSGAAPAIAMGDGSPATVLSALDAHYGLGDGYRLDGKPEKLPDGRVVYQFSRPERHSLGMEHDGSELQVELHSGVSATFDASGKLLSSFYTPIGDEEKANAQTFAADLMARGRVKENTFMLASHNPEGKVYLGQLVDDFEKPGVKMLQRLPNYDL